MCVLNITRQAPAWNTIAQAFSNNSKVVFGDVNLAEDQVQGQYAGEPGAGGWPTIRTYNSETGCECSSFALCLCLLALRLIWLQLLRGARVSISSVPDEGKFAGDWKDSNSLDGAMCDVFGKEETMQVQRCSPLATSLPRLTCHLPSYLASLLTSPRSGTLRRWRAFMRPASLWAACCAPTSPACAPKRRAASAASRRWGTRQSSGTFLSPTSNPASSSSQPHWRRAARTTYG